MGKLEKIDKLQKMKESGALTEEEFNNEKLKILNNEKNGSKDISVTIVLILIIVLVAIIMILMFRKKSNNGENQLASSILSSKGIETTENLDDLIEESNEDEMKETSKVNSESANVNTGNVSFANINSSNNNLDEIQQSVVNYFDNNYIWYNVRFAQLYPQIFRDIRIYQYFRVLKVLKSDDEEFEVIGVQVMEYDYYRNKKIEEIPEEYLLYVSGKQLNQRLTADTYCAIYGKFNDIISKEIDGKSYMVSSISANEVIRGEDRYSFENIKEIAEYIFGKDIKINKPTSDTSFYKITLDNQSNSNFKVFDIFNNYGEISYDYEDNGISDSIQKRLFITMDFEHYIVSTYDENLKYVYIDYFDKDFNKIWSREFQYSSSKAYVSPLDYTLDKMAFVVDNDFYLIDINTGEDIIAPVLVGEKIKVNMMSDGIVLIGDNNKDGIMKVDYSGNIIFRQNAGIDFIFEVNLQIIEDRIVLIIDGAGADAIDMEKIYEKVHTEPENAYYIPATATEKAKIFTDVDGIDLARSKRNGERSSRRICDSTK